MFYFFQRSKKTTFNTHLAYSPQLSRKKCVIFILEIKLRCNSFDHSKFLLIKMYLPLILILLSKIVYPLIGNKCILLL